MAVTKSSIELKVLGQKLILKSDADSARSRRVVDWVTERVTMIEKRIGATSKSTVIPPMHIALLALLEIGQEYLDSKDKTEKHQAEMNQIAKMLMQELQNKSSESPKAQVDAAESTDMPTHGLTIQSSSIRAKKKTRRGPAD